MIDYSVYLLGNPLDPTAAPKAYARAQMRENMTFSKFVNHIAQHNGVFSRGTVKGVLTDACSCIVEQLLEGKKVQLGELGSFWISLNSNGAESMEDFSASQIKAVNIVFTPGDDFMDLRNKAEFNMVASRVAQVATLKTEKAGGTTVDLEAARAASRTGGSEGTNGESGSSSSSGSSGESGSNGSSGSSGESGSSGSTGTNGSSSVSGSSSSSGSSGESGSSVTGDGTATGDGSSTGSEGNDDNGGDNGDGEF